ncbi:MAG: hypothetical protein ACI89U_003142, partial [Gammaproteobacteria bacterium]
RLMRRPHVGDAIIVDSLGLKKSPRA